MKQVIDESFLQQLELFTLAVKDNVAGLFGGNHKSKKYGSSCEFADYRDYLEGDDISKIDWNLYGKFEKMYLKLFLDERQMQTRIYIDGSGSMSYFHKDEYVIRLATALAYLSVAEMDKVNVYYIHGTQCEPLIENLVGKDSFMNSVSRFNNIKFEGESEISSAIIRSTVGYGDGRSILISDFETDKNYTDAIDYLRGKRRDVLCLQVLADEEIHPTLRGKNIIHDSENDNHIYKSNVTRDVLKAYQKAIDYVEKKIQDYCYSREADYLLCSTKDTLKDVFLNKMVQRGILK
jgi:hypothetical protein